MNAARNALQAVMPQRGQADSHPGLLLQRFLRESAAGDEGKPQEKRGILNAAIGSAKNDETRILYTKAFARWDQWLKERGEIEPVNLQTIGRLIVGLGSENVLETGIRLHHTYGMPIIPGSALKGLTAHYCDQVWGTSDKRFKQPTRSEDEAYRKYLAGKGPNSEDSFHRLLFGTTDDSGCIIFHDAWLTPDSPEPLKLDVMTPHHPNWLDGSVEPTDFDSPTPVPFLSVTGTFRVAVSWHGPTSDKAKNWTELARSLLCDALKDWGIGGKTTSGYGRLAHPATPDGPELASASKAASQVVERPRPKYKRGESIQVTREQINDKVKFRADDGLLGHFIAPESPPAGDTPTVWVANVNPQGYTLTMKQPELKAKSSKPDRRGKRR